MKSHEDIDKRSLILAKAIIAKIDADPVRSGVDKAKAVCTQWIKSGKDGAVKEWFEILKSPWDDIKKILVDNTEKGDRLRQSNPFCGILTNQERWQFYRECEKNEAE